MNTINKPVRKFSRSRSSLRGTITSLKDNVVHGFESSLEKDFIELVEFDSNVSRYIEQPLEIQYQENGINRSYTPDFLVYYEENSYPSSEYSPLLCEVKYLEELKKNMELLQPKFNAAEKFARSKGWRFKVLTEKEIRTPYLKNAKFLNNYRDSKFIEISDFALLLDRIVALRFSTLEELIIASTRCDDKKAQLIYTLWYMIANGYIACDLTNPLTMKTEIWTK